MQWANTEESCFHLERGLMCILHLKDDNARQRACTFTIYSLTLICSFFLGLKCFLSPRAMVSMFEWVSMHVCVCFKEIPANTLGHYQWTLQQCHNSLGFSDFCPCYLQEESVQLRPHTLVYQPSLCFHLSLAGTCFLCSCTKCCSPRWEDDFHIAAGNFGGLGRGEGGKTEVPTYPKAQKGKQFNSQK